MKTPLSVKFLSLTYLITLVSKVSSFFEEKQHGLGDTLGAVAVIAITLGLLYGIQRRISWIWMAGLADCAFWVIISSRQLLRGDHNALNETLVDPSLISELGTEQLELINTVASLGGTLFVWIGAVSTAWLWWATRQHFENRTVS